MDILSKAFHNSFSILIRKLKLKDLLRYNLNFGPILTITGRGEYSSLKLQLDSGVLIRLDAQLLQERLLLLVVALQDLVDHLVADALPLPVLPQDGLVLPRSALLIFCADLQMSKRVCQLTRASPPCRPCTRTLYALANSP